MHVNSDFNTQNLPDKLIFFHSRLKLHTRIKKHRLLKMYSVLVCNGSGVGVWTHHMLLWPALQFSALSTNYIQVFQDKKKHSSATLKIYYFFLLISVSVCLQRSV